MSTLLESVFDIKEIGSSDQDKFKPNLFNNNRRSKENIFKSKSHKELKKKLKKYKLRRDGQEDPEVLDVSQILVSTLKIKSPNNKIESGINGSEEYLGPRNYLFKMGRKKQTIKIKGGSAEDNELKANYIEKKEGNVCDNNIMNTSSNHKNLDILKIESEQSETYPYNSKDKKHTNAFALMMDSRNKSIGSNSPGKDKIADELDHQELDERKNIKAKRNLMLQKMADAKGALKNKELEELQDQCIKNKMEKRAERLKHMIKEKESKPIPNRDKMICRKEIPCKSIPANNNDLEILSLKNKLKLVNIFNDHVKSQNIPNSKVKETVTKEEKEFLKKLSPSLKKKENMLCYFKKVEKGPDEFLDSPTVEDDTAVIKVKLKLKGKKIKKKKLSLNKVISNEELHCENDNENHDYFHEMEIKETVKMKKQDKKQNNDEKLIIPKIDDCDFKEIDAIRPRRNVKRPAKYIDDVHLSSSDDELLIFTPKKKKHAEKSKKCVLESNNTNETLPKQIDKSKKEIKITTLERNNKKIKKDGIETKKLTKLAPIFAVKPQLDAAAIEAKQRFLSSGVPEKLKKIIEKQSSMSVGLNNFHAVVHVQQTQITCPKTNNLLTVLNQSESDEDIDEIQNKPEFSKGLNIFNAEQKIENNNLIVAKQTTQVVLQNLKKMYPRFPVYRTYRLLKDKNNGEFKDCSYLDLDNSIEVINEIIDINNESPDKLSWADKYKAMSSKQIIGNFESIKELKKWLITWTENEDKLKKRNDSDSSDFYLSDTDSKDSIKSTNNLLVLTGPVGSGKTSLVYAVAAELAIKVLEVNASSKRTGKIMLQDLQEATQSHKVNRGKSSQEHSQKSQEINIIENAKTNKKRGRPKKVTENITKKSEHVIKKEVLSQPSGSQDSVRTCMSLILIDDADIVFEQDDGFCSAIVQLVQCSKRPVILITTSKSCPHLQRFLQCAKIIHTRPFLPRMLGTWLDIMCLVDTGSCWPGLGAKSLDYFNGDIRKTINFLQLNIVKDTLEDNSPVQNDDDYKVNIEDENSNLSWLDREEKEEDRELNLVGCKIWKYFMNDQANLLCLQCPVNVFKIWWNVPRLLITRLNCNIHDENKKMKHLNTNIKRNIELDVLSNVTDMISIADYFCHTKTEIDSEPIAVPWVSYETNSVSELENFNRYDRLSEIQDELSHTLLSRSIVKAQSDLDLQSLTDLEFPGMAFKREKNKISSRHNSLTSFFNPSSALDRRALALDYWSGCRTICRVEKTRTDSNLKRNNRFCHYLKSANILCKSDSFDKLSDSLCCGEVNVKYNVMG